MSIRLRLALWYAGLTSLVVIAIVVTAYVIHNRSAYEHVDQSLVNVAEHFRQELAAPPGAGLGQSTSPGDSTVLVRLYDAEGRVLAASPAVPAPPPLDAAQALREDSGPAYDGILRWLPGGETFEEGEFATAGDPASGDRIRLFVLPVDDGRGAAVGYVQTWASLGSLDRSMRTFRYLMLGLGGTGILAVWLGSLLIAGRALQPVAAMIRTARAIAASRGFSRRLPDPRRRDELGQLARTFNEMLASLEEAYRSQQRFIADAAHELRAPLTAIQGNIELLGRMREMSDEERAEGLAYLEGEARRLSRIVSELLTLARADAGQTLDLRPLELDRVLLEVLIEVRTLAADHQLELTHLEPVAIEGDVDRLKQLLMNLLDNSLKYTVAGGRITVGLERTPTEAVLTVRDTGVGIAAEDLPHVFERFYRADPARSHDPAGTGLGLSIAKWVVDQHGGTIALESQPQRGTAVVVRLPAAPQDAAGRPPVPSQARTPSTG